jgi:hypothetical protein
MKVLLFALIISTSIQAQEVKYASLNIIFSGVISGIGSGVHKHEGQNFGQAFVNGFWKGCIGGGLNVASKEMLLTQTQNTKMDWKLCWGSKIINSVSNDIIYTASLNKNNYVDNYSINIGFVRLSLKYKAQVDPISLSCFVYSVSTKGKINVENSLIIGTPVFDYDFKRIITVLETKTISRPSKLGQAFAQNVLIEKNLKSNPILIHEVIHTYQRLQYSNLNNVIKNYYKYENFGFIHNDLSSFDIAYFAMNKTIGYSRNYFEYEADFYGQSK